MLERLFSDILFINLGPQVGNKYFKKYLVFDYHYVKDLIFKEISFFPNLRILES